MALEGSRPYYALKQGVALRSREAKGLNRSSTRAHRVSERLFGESSAWLQEEAQESCGSGNCEAARKYDATPGCDIGGWDGDEGESMGDSVACGGKRVSGCHVADHAVLRRIDSQRSDTPSFLRLPPLAERIAPGPVFGPRPHRAATCSTSALHSRDEIDGGDEGHGWHMLINGDSEAKLSPGAAGCDKPFVFAATDCANATTPVAAIPQLSASDAGDATPRTATYGNSGSCRSPGNDTWHDENLLWSPFGDSLIMPGASSRLSPTVSPRLSPRLSLAALDSIVLGDELWRSIERLDGRADGEEGCDDEGRGAQEGCGAEEGCDSGNDGATPWDDVVKDLFPELHAAAHDAAHDAAPPPPPPPPTSDIVLQVPAISSPPAPPSPRSGPTSLFGSLPAASIGPPPSACARADSPSLDAAQLPSAGSEPMIDATRLVRGAPHTGGAAPPLLCARAPDRHDRRACALLALPAASSRIPPPACALKRRADELRRGEGARSGFAKTPPASRSCCGAADGPDWQDPATRTGGGRVRPGPPSPLLLPPLALPPSSPPVLRTPSSSFSALTLPTPLALPTPSTPFPSDRAPPSATAHPPHPSPAHLPASPSPARCPATSRSRPWRNYGAAERPGGGDFGGTAVGGGATMGRGATVGTGAAVTGRAAVGIRKIVGAHTVALGLRGVGKADAPASMEITAQAEAEGAAAVVTPVASAALVGATTARTPSDAQAVAAERETAAAAAAPGERGGSAELARAAGGAGSAAGEGLAGAKRRKVGGGGRVCMSAEAAAALEEYREKAAQRQRRGTAMDAQSVAARRRRANISSRMGVLKSLVPGSARLDTASLLERAAAYIAFLHDHSLAAGAGHADQLQARFTDGLGAADEVLDGGGSDACAHAGGVGAGGSAAGAGNRDGGGGADDADCMDI